MVKEKQLATNYWSNLRGHGDLPSTKGVPQMSWEKGGRQKGSFGCKGNKLAKDMRV